MPELPEVEHTRENLHKWMHRARVLAVAVHDPRLVRPLAPAGFAALLTGKVVTSIDRRGKWLRLLFGAETRLFVHLGMTGWFEHSSGVPSGNPHPSANGDALRFERVRFELAHPRKKARTAVSYVDPRRWGQLVLADHDIPAFTKLGPDPLTDGIDLELLARRLARRKKQSIKESLMDQTVLAGVGNIQAMEALWHARIDPRTPAPSIATKELRAIVRGLTWTITRTLEDLSSERSGNGNPFKIYGRKGEPCPRCRAELIRYELGGRTTTACPRCQPPRYTEEP